MPGVEGNINDNTGDMVRIILSEELKTLSRGGTSLIESIAKHTTTPEKYVRVFGLRNHGVSPITGEPKQEIVYIHSKLMIVDDDKLIMGSANINDRSMLGHRDTEIAMVFEDTYKVNGTLNSKNHKYSCFSHTFRKNLFRHTFDMLDEQVEDPLDDKMWEFIDKHAKRNTFIYRVVFGPYPDDLIRKYKDINVIKDQADVQKYWELKNDIKGYACEWPLEFLCEEDLDKQKYLNFGMAIAPRFIFT